MNLALLSEFFKAIDISQLTSDQLLDDQWSPVVPEIKISDHLDIKWGRDYDYSIDHKAVKRQQGKGYRLANKNNLLQAHGDLRP